MGDYIAGDFFKAKPHCSPKTEDSNHLVCTLQRSTYVYGVPRERQRRIKVNTFFAAGSLNDDNIKMWNGVHYMHYVYISTRAIQQTAGGIKSFAITEHHSQMGQ